MVTADDGAEDITPWTAAELLWPFHEMVRARMLSFGAMPEKTAADEAAARAAVDALGTDAETAAWQALSPGAWRVLSEHIAGCMVIMLSAHVAGRAAYRIPAGQSDEQRRKLLARTALRRAWLPERTPPQSPPASGPAKDRLRGH